MKKLSIVLVTLIFSVTGCGVSHVNFDDNYTRKQYSTPKKSSVSLCRVYIPPVKDSRPAGDALGHASYTFLQEDNFIPWINSAMTALDEKMFVVVEEPSKSDITLQVEAVKAYLQGLSTSRVANIVIKAHISSVNHPQTTHVVRGNDTSVNWWGAGYEMKDSMNQAVNNILLKLEPKLQQYCNKEMSKAAS